ncbi:MAG: hypothetical protein KatS3mg060_1189 [Dehalococcoidia bacterium]|nr:MAG: hypothetical protein KatS3mg060_1189 [Dehalococcoidia bacterium]
MTSSAVATLPRRRRTCVCAEFRLDGEPVTLVRIAAMLAARSSPSSTQYLAGHRLHCCRRPHDLLPPSYADDVCLSSWSRGCPWRTEEGR